MDKRNRPQAHNVFKPVDHVVAAFRSMDDMQSAADALAQAGFADSEVERYTPEQMKSQADTDIAKAGLLASVGQELNLVKAHRELAEHGHAFLVVHAPKDQQTQQVAEVLRQHGAVRAQKYGSFLIEELIEVGDGLSQVGESPDRGLDAQNLSGSQSEASRPR